MSFETGSAFNMQLSGRSTNFFTQLLLSWPRTQPHMGLGTRRYFSETVERNWQGSRQLPTQLDAPTFTLDYITHCCISHMTPWKAAYERNLSEAWLGSKVRWLHLLSLRLHRHKAQSYAWLYNLKLGCTISSLAMQSWDWHALSRFWEWAQSRIVWNPKLCGTYTCNTYPSKLKICCSLTSSCSSLFWLCFRVILTNVCIRSWCMWMRGHW